MKRQDEPSDPTNAPARQPDAAGLPPRAPFEPPIRDPGVLALLKGLNPPDAPIPTLTSSTDGELSASFSAAPREAPSARDVVVPSESVVVGPYKTPPKKKKAPAPEQLSSTFRLRPAQPSLALPVALAVLVGGGGSGLWIAFHGSSEGTVRAPAATVAAAAPLPKPAPVPTAPVAAPAPPTLAVEAVEPGVPAPEPVRAAPSSSAGPAPSVRPAKAVAPRRKEDEPDREL